MILFSLVATRCIILLTENTAIFKGLPLCMWLFTPVFSVSHISHFPARCYKSGQQIVSSQVHLHWFRWNLLQGSLPLVPLVYKAPSSSSATAASERGKSSPWNGEISSGVLSTGKKWTCWSRFRGGSWRWLKCWSTSPVKTAPKRAVVIQPREEKDLSRSYSTFQYVKRAHKKGTNLQAGLVATGQMIMILN